jgi:prepilin-type N-terminal cleavage/methylation domain-containing protein
MIQRILNKSKGEIAHSGIDRGEEGFTLAEFLVAMALLTVLMAGMVKLFTLLDQSYTTQNVAAGVQQVVRTGIDIMTKNIRMAGFNPLKLPDVGIQTDISQSKIHFSYDLDADGSISNDNEDISYLYEDQQVKRITGSGATEAFINNVSDLKFTYRDLNDQTTSNHKAVKTVEISMTVTEPAGRRGMLSRTYFTRVICRNQ